MSADAPHQEDRANGRPYDSGVIHANVMAAIDNVEVFARTRVAGARYKAICVTPMRLDSARLRVILDVDTRDEHFGVHGR